MAGKMTKFTKGIGLSVVLASTMFVMYVARAESVENGALSAPAERQSPANMTNTGPQFLWAVVNSDGTLARGKYAVSARRGDLPSGSYVVKFSRNISACSYVATPGLSSNFGIEKPAFVTVVRRNSDPSAVYVAVFGIGGSSRPDRGFHLAVQC